jgi:hypothetical protein
MALPVEPHAPAYTGLAAASHWIAASAPGLLIVIYFAGFLCGVLLAVHVGRISRGLRRLERDAARQAVVLKNLRESFDAAAARSPSAEDPDGQNGAANPACPADPAPSDWCRMREEIQSVLDDISADLGPQADRPDEP